MTRACTLLIRRETDVQLPRKAPGCFIQGRTGHHTHHNTTVTRAVAPRPGGSNTVQVYLNLSILKM